MHDERRLNRPVLARGFAIPQAVWVCARNWESRGRRFKSCRPDVLFWLVGGSDFSVAPRHACRRVSERFAENRILFPAMTACGSTSWSLHLGSTAPYGHGNCRHHCECRVVQSSERLLDLLRCDLT